MIIKPDWNIFKAKFSENPQKNFEWLCYLLFCQEFNLEFGVMGYLNQRHIENNPIKKDGNIIAWQAKFYETPLSSHKIEIIKMIEGVKKDYPNVDKIIFYTNQNWGQGRKQNEPQVKSDIDNKARDLGIEIDWDHMDNFFHSRFVSIGNELIVKHFFTNEKSFIDILKTQRDHNDNILKEIKSNIIFVGKKIEIDRNLVIENLSKNSTGVFILSGSGGVGKTAVIKKLYKQLKDDEYFYIFKATEFELRNIRDFFKDYSFEDFINAHKTAKNKTVVIDSAEKLIDLKSTDAFKEFLTITYENNWKIIFTIRDNYIENLNYQILEIYNIIPNKIDIQNLNIEELGSFSKKFSFALPKDPKLIELIKNPFYLNEYLRFYKNDDDFNYVSFKNILWDKNIKKAMPTREQCFLRIAHEKAKEGNFYINSDKTNCESSIFDELHKDSILCYETNGYFISHDIYEEWALERIIELEFNNREDDQTFFNNIGQSLPIRRSFRNWISERLLQEDIEIKKFIERNIKNDSLESFWKDEVLVSILLSNYSDNFFNNSKDILLKENQELLKKLSFLLRIGCKEIDENKYKKLKIKGNETDLFRWEIIYTKPRGRGWNNFIKFIFENFDSIDSSNINIIIPIIYDWNGNFFQGETTKHASLIALKYYKTAPKENEENFYDYYNLKYKVLEIIFLGSLEIKDELKKIFEKILANKWRNHEDPYYDFSKFILTEPLRILPLYNNYFSEYILQIADLFWHRNANDFNLRLDQYFGIKNYTEYFPSSPFKTPIFFLLNTDSHKTIDFILDFINNAVKFFASSDIGRDEVKEIEVFIDENKTVKQYICDRLWCTYRGTAASSELLESIHMALEKFLLENAINYNSKELEDLLLYLLKKSISSSISAVVASVVLAYPDKTFNVAKVLFKTKYFFQFDQQRKFKEDLYKNNELSILQFQSTIRKENRYLFDERLESSKLNHRRFDLESLFLYYPLLLVNMEGDRKVKEKQKILWEILDNYYKQLPPKSEQTEQDVVWIFAIKRMDCRNMEVDAKQGKNNEIELRFINTNVDDDLKKISEDAQNKIAEETKYLSLMMWGEYKIKKDEKYKQYEKYDKNPKLAFKEAKEIYSKFFGNNTISLSTTLEVSIPGIICSVLVRDCLDNLSREEINFCKDIIIETILLSLNNNYEYQQGISDNVLSAISVLPLLLETHPEERDKITNILLFILLDINNIRVIKKFSEHAADAISNYLWEKDFKHAYLLLLNYLSLKAKNDTSIESNYFEISNGDALKRYFREELSINDIKNIEELDLDNLWIALAIIPIRIENEKLKWIAKKIISIYAKKLLLDYRNKDLYYEVTDKFLEKLAYIILNLQKGQIEEYFKLFIDDLENEIIANLLNKLILITEIKQNHYNNFWEIWNLLKNKIIKISKDELEVLHRNKVLRSYLFSNIPLEGIYQQIPALYVLKDKDKKFFEEIPKIFGDSTLVLYCISKLLYGFGSSYLDDGVIWLSDMLSRNKSLFTVALDEDTVYFLEIVIRKYIYLNRRKIIKNKILKKNILIILDFLIRKGSIIGYMLRENII